MCGVKLVTGLTLLPECFMKAGVSHILFHLVVVLMDCDLAKYLTMADICRI